MHTRHLIFITLLSTTLTAAQKVAILSTDPANSPAAHGVDVLRKTLTAKGLEITTEAAANYLLVLGNTTASKAPESIEIRHGQRNGKPAILLNGADSRGRMYAALDTAEKIDAAPAATPFLHLKDVTEKPYIAERGISTYTMQRVYFEQRLYDENYWTRYFDLLARDRINSFVLIFGYENGGFMAPLYPYFFNTPNFPGVEFVGITPEQQTKNTKAFKTLIRIAHERGIDVTAGIWDHIYRGGVQGGGIPGASENAGKRVPGLVFGVTTENLSDYTKASLNEFLKVFPEVDALQLRMHNESGLKNSEMYTFWHDVFTAIKRDHPNLRLDLRAKELPDEIIYDALNQGLKTTISTKYWMEQMGMPFHPTHINKSNQKDRRHGYADLLHYPQRYRIRWQLWSGGTTRLLLWGDPEYVRRFAESVHLYDGNSFELNEMLATKMLGEQHDAPVRDVHNPAYRHYDYEFERYWHFYRVWGRLTYNPKAEPATWTREFDKRFGPTAGPHLMRALNLASNVLPRIVAASYLYSNFPTTRGWAEMDRQRGLPIYAATDEGSDIQQFMNVRDEAKSILDGSLTAMRRPEETSRWFAQTAGTIDAEIKQAGAGSSKEFTTTVTDLKILAGLARYHSNRLLAGVSYSLYQQTQNLGAFDDAISSERRAIDAWKQIVADAGNVYSKDLAFGAHAVGFSRHWEEELAKLNKEFALLTAMRDQLVSKAPNAAHPQPKSTQPEPPTAKLDPATKALPSHDYIVNAKVTAPAGLMSVTLRYRHVNQTENYQTAEMKFDPKTKAYTAAIPANFIDPKWDLMYFVEAIGRNGAGRMFPDLETAAPYIIVPVRR